MHWEVLKYKPRFCYNSPLASVSTVYHLPLIVGTRVQAAAVRAAYTEEGGGLARYSSLGASGFNFGRLKSGCCVTCLVCIVSATRAESVLAPPVQLTPRVWGRSPNFI